MCLHKAYLVEVRADEMGGISYSECETLIESGNLRYIDGVFYLLTQSMKDLENMHLLLVKPVVDMHYFCKVSSVGSIGIGN